MCDVKSTSTFKSLAKQLGFTAGKLSLVAAFALGGSFSAAPAYASANEFLGLLGGAVGGGFIGNQIGKGSGRTWATAGGAVLGGLAGQSVGQSLDRGNAAYYGNSGRGDRYYSRYNSPTVYYSEPAPQRVYYVPSYEQRVQRVEVIPAPVRYVESTSYVVDNSYGGSSNSGYCREYNQGVTVGGRTQPSYGTACMQPDGSWKIQ